MVNTAAVVLLGVLASGWDIRTRRIPNVLTLGFPVAALVVHVVLDGAPGAGNTAAGWAAGLALFLPMFILGGMGAGDVKLLAAVGAWLGPWNVLETALAAGVIGGVLALGLALTRSYASQAFTNIWSLLLFWRVAGIRAHPTLTLAQHDGPRLAYAIPISMGAMVAIWV
jgi:prepilin peptidase CpaA